MLTRHLQSPTPPIAQAFFLHGFSDHCNAYFSFPPTLALAGIEFFSFDQRGWGRSCGSNKAQWGVSGDTRQLFADIDELLLLRLSAHPGLPLFLVSHSMGGGTGLAYAHSGAHRDKLAGVVAWSPMIDFAAESRPSVFMLAAGKLAARIFPGYQMLNRLNATAMSRDAEACRVFANDQLCHDTGTLLGIAEMLDRGKGLRDKSVVKRFPENLPVLVAHGTGDKVTDCEASRKFVDMLEVKDKTFKAYDGWYHKLHAEPEEDRAMFANDVVEWIRARCSETSRL